MEHIDARRALELLIDVVDQYGEDTVYEKIVDLRAGSDPDSNYSPGCWYEYNNEPSCLVAHALHNAGVPLHVLRQLDLGGHAAAELDVLDVGDLSEHVTEDAARIFNTAQVYQDNGDTWGEALKASRFVYNSLTEEGAGK